MSMENFQPSPEKVLAILQSDDTDALRDAAFSAGDMNLEEAIPLLCQHVSSSNIGIQEAAEYALRKIRGPKAVAALLPLLSYESASVRNVAMDILREICVDGIESMRHYLTGDDPDIRIFIADILGYCRSHQAAVLLGEAMLKDPEVNVRQQAAVSLGNLAYPESVNDLVQAMQDEEWVQFSAVEALAKIKDPSAIKAMVDLLPKSTMLISSAIIDALGNMGDVKTIPLLFRSLEDVNEALRHKIVKAIVQILNGTSLSLLSEKAQVRLHTYLLDALTDSDDEIQMAALKGLSVIGRAEATKNLLQFAVGLDPERDPELYEATIRALAAIGYNDTIRDALNSTDENFIMVAMEACQLLEDRRPIEELKKIFWRISLDLQRAAVAEIAQLGNCDDMAFFLSVMDECKDAEILKSSLVFFGNQDSCQDVDDVVFAQLSHQYQDVKEMALEACINLHSPKLNDNFKQMRLSSDIVDRMMAVYALGRYSVPQNLEDITEALADEDAAVRRVAVEAFLNLGGAAERYLPRLLPRLVDDDKDVRIAIVDLLGQIGTPTVVPHLLSALNDQDEWVKIRAVEALGENRIGECVPVLAQMLEQAHPMIAFKIIESLGKIGGNVAFNVLLGMMVHEDPEIQHAAAEAVAAIQANQE